MTVVILLTLLSGTLLAAGCTVVKDPIIGTFEWSDGKGYTEWYTFSEDRTFHAGALGAGFSGTWERVAPARYQVTYQAEDREGQDETHTDLLLYDSATDAIYFPAHPRVR
jgi:hypothetical protein